LEAWVVYFDAGRGLAELREHGLLFDRVSLSAYELDSAGVVRPAPGMAELAGPFLQLADELDFAPWVTAVNDVRYSRDSAIAKDPNLVHTLITDPDRREAHVADLVQRVLARGFHGLPLDYEQLSEADSVPYRRFVSELREELDRRGLGFEVVLEPLAGPLPDGRGSRVTVWGAFANEPSTWAAAARSSAGQVREPASLSNCRWTLGAR
jgi:hypothetical protein